MPEVKAEENLWGTLRFSGEEASPELELVWYGTEMTGDGEITFERAEAPAETAAE